MMNILKSSEIKSPLGKIMVMGSDKELYFLEFMESRGFERRLVRFMKKIGATVEKGNNAIISSIEKELNQYFEGKLKVFTIPLMQLGTSFQKQVWKKLSQTSWGETLSYSDLAVAVGNPLACRAVANANGANHIAIVVPCHRIIQANGTLGGYGGGLDRKRWLLDLEGAKYRLPS
jgi:AraC family transcriptional regulator of adaptative response/methylated-DNA-[protein]-cysteine methyltransferase